MTRKNLRRTPKQGRAQATVDAVVEATAQLLIEGGFERLTSAGIAERAGVSVGTLYQYFPNKEAVVEAVVDRVIREQIGALERQVARVGSMSEPSLENGARILIDGALAAVQVRPELSQRLLLGNPRHDALELKHEWKRRCTDLVRILLYEAKATEVRTGHPDLMASFLVISVFAILQDAVAFRPELLASDTLREELTLLVIRYLSP